MPNLPPFAPSSADGGFLQTFPYAAFSWLADVWFSLSSFYATALETLHFPSILC